MTLMDVAHDFAVVSILLAIGYFLRMKVKLFQRLFLPASIIGEMCIRDSILKRSESARRHPVLPARRQ